MSQLASQSFNPFHLNLVLKCVIQFIQQQNGKKIQLPESNEKMSTYEFLSDINNNESKKMLLQYSQRQKSYKIVISYKLQGQKDDATFVKIVQTYNEKSLNENTCYEILQPNSLTVRTIIEKESLKDTDNQTIQYISKLLNDIYTDVKEIFTKIITAPQEKITISCSKEKQLYEIIAIFKSNFDLKCKQGKQQQKMYVFENQDATNASVIEKNDSREVQQQKMNKLSSYQARVAQARRKRKYELVLNPLACKILIRKQEIDKSWKQHTPSSGYAILQKVSAQYTILESFNSPTVELIKKLKKDATQKTLFNTFIKKTCNEGENLTNDQLQIRWRSFQTQIEVAKIIRDAQVESIAEFFIEDTKRLDRETSNLYTKMYCQCLYEYKMTGKVLIPIILLLLQGLNALNDFEILHRDLKPANIMLDTKKNPKIIDFGSSCSRNGGIAKQKMNLILHTTQYYNIRYDDLLRNQQAEMSRQEFENHELFDFYSLGRILERFSTDINVSRDLGLNLAMNFSWISKKCMNRNPNMRLNCQQVIFLITVLHKIWSLKKKNFN